MPIETLDALKLAHERKRRTNVLKTNRFHAVVLYYGPPFPLRFLAPVPGSFANFLPPVVFASS